MTETPALNKVQTRFLAPQRAAVQLRVDGEEGASPVITGYGAVFYNAADEGTQYDLWGDGSILERIMPGAFDRPIAEDDVRSLFNHDSNIVLGRNRSQTLVLSADDVGLRYEVTPPNTQLIRDQVLAPIERGDVSGSSFMFVPTDTVWREVDDVWIREINDVELWETGPVTFPAYESTTTGLRSVDREALREELDAFRRSRSAADRDVRQRRIDTRFRIAELQND